MSTERTFPPQCPNCKALNAVEANPHCTSLWCPWLRCRCGAVIGEQGAFRIMPGGGE